MFNINISILNNIYDDITTHKYDLIFTHSLSTHEPYGFDGKCDYSGKRYINYSYTYIFLTTLYFSQCNLTHA